MEIRELLDQLDAHRGSFPEHLIGEVIARQQEIVPLLLEILEDIDRDPEPWLEDEETIVHIYAMYLLAFFRETRAYPLLVRIFSRPDDFAYELTGDVASIDLGRILASVSGGDISGMTALIENEQTDEYVRSLAMESMVFLVTTGQRTRDEVMAYFLQLFHQLDRQPGIQWNGLVSVCTDLWPQETMSEIRRAYEDDLVDPDYIAWEEVEDVLKLGKDDAIRKSQYRDPLINDLAKDMGWMDCFHAKRSAEPETDWDDVIWPSSNESMIPEPIRRTEPKIGRNEPCPCGSGKKFKKCCGGNGEPVGAAALPN
jgi:hypothetical protein